MKVIKAIEKTRVLLNHQLDAAKTQTERNKLGQFATPGALALEIVEFARRLLPANFKIRFLDPAFGTGSFYSALLQQFPPEQIVEAVGYEIDPHYGLEATKLWSHAPLQLHLADFTQATPPNSNEAKANLLICNPPYVRHHHLTREEKLRLQRTTKQTVGVQLSGLAGLYCHFLCLSDAFLQAGGLAGWLIPSGFMDVNYGQQIKEYLTERVTLLRVHRFAPVQLQFEDALVSSAVIWLRKEQSPAFHAVEFTYGGSLTVPQMSQMVSIAELRRTAKWTQFGRGSNRHSIEKRQLQIFDATTDGANGVGLPSEVASAACMPRLAGAVRPTSSWMEEKEAVIYQNEAAQNLKLSRATNLSDELALGGKDFETQKLKLSDLFTIKRGLATGANHFFVLTSEQISQYQLPKAFFQPILPSPRYLLVDEIEADRFGNPILDRQLFLLTCYLFEDDVFAKYPSLWQYLQLGREKGISDRYLCRHRNPWYSQENRPPAPFLCTYMGRENTSRGKPFRFILNRSMATASNVYLMLYPKPFLKQALSARPLLLKKVWQALNQLSEQTLIGESRVYGGGLHKLEPNELGNASAVKIQKILLDQFD
ncbi:MAG: N-6 DNA methylase [Hydrococcus sp. Prado102]|jgi:hypothetical protein|nr:N-6 DNA methylase [Hydrococcus sp. Prado102]